MEWIVTFYDSVAICIHLADVKISIFQDIFGKDVILSEVDNKSDQFSGSAWQLLEHGASCVEFAETGFFPTPTSVKELCEM